MILKNYLIMRTLRLSRFRLLFSICSIFILFACNTTEKKSALMETDDSGLGGGSVKILFQDSNAMVVCRLDYILQVPRGAAILGYRKGHRSTVQIFSIDAPSTMPSTSSISCPKFAGKTSAGKLVFIDISQAGENYITLVDPNTLSAEPMPISPNFWAKSNVVNGSTILLKKKIPDFNDGSDKFQMFDFTSKTLANYSAPQNPFKPDGKIDLDNGIVWDPVTKRIYFKHHQLSDDGGTVEQSIFYHDLDVNSQLKKLVTYSAPHDSWISFDFDLCEDGRIFVRSRQKVETRIPKIIQKLELHTLQGERRLLAEYATKGGMGNIVCTPDANVLLVKSSWSQDSRYGWTQYYAYRYVRFDLSKMDQEYSGRSNHPGVSLLDFYGGDILEEYVKERGAYINYILSDGTFLINWGWDYRPFRRWSVITDPYSKDKIKAVASIGDFIKEFVEKNYFP